MPRGTGNKTGGRKKGTPNKATVADKQRIADLMRSKNYCPFEAMIEIAQIAMKDKDYHLSGMMAKELAQYSRPKLKAITVSGDMSGNMVVQWRETKRFDGSLDPDKSSESDTLIQ